jgi:hypothetical protein
MNTEELKQHIDESGDSAYGVLLDAIPQASRRFERLTRGLYDLIQDVRKEFPDACYYSANGTVNLLLTESHDRKGRTQQFGIALVALRLDIGGGDW